MLGAHELRGADGRACQRWRRPARRLGPERCLVRSCHSFRPPNDLGEAPVHNERLAVGAEHDVARFQVAVQDAAAVRVGNRVADVHETAQEPAKLQRPLASVAVGRLVVAVDSLFQAIPLDEAHGVERPAVGILAQTVDRDYARVLQTARHLGFHEEASPAVAVMSMAVLDLFERHFAMQLFVAGDKHFAQAALGVRPQNAEALTCGGRGPG